MPLLDLFPLWAIFFSRRHVIAPCGAKSCVRRGQPSADLQPPPSSLRVFNSASESKLPHCVFSKSGWKVTSYDCTRSFSFTFHLLAASRLSFLVLLSDAATSGTYIKTVGDVEHKAKIRAICLNIFCVHSLICLFVWWRLLSRWACPYARFSSLAPALLQHFKWHGVFN